MIDGFILSSAVGGRREAGLAFQGRLADGRRFRWQVTRPRLCFFVDRDAPACENAARKSLDLRTLSGRPVDALYFTSGRDLLAARRHYEALGHPLYEADVPAAARHLMERGIKGAVRFPDPPAREENGVLIFIDPKVEPSDFTPKLRLLSLDVECSMDGELFSIAVHADAPSGTTAFAPSGTGAFAAGVGEPIQAVWVVDPEGARAAGTPEIPGTAGSPKPAGYVPCPDEKSVLREFLRATAACDPDALIGWNVINFDLRWLANKCRRLGVPFALGVDAGPGTSLAEMVEPEGRGGRFGPGWLARVPGRAVLDGIAMLRAAFVQMEGYSLGAVAQEILGKQKLIELEGKEKTDEIARRFREDKEALARYNLMDAQLAHEIFAKLSLSQLAVRKAQLTGLSVDRMAGSMAALDFLYLPRLHRRGFVADTGNTAPGDEGVPGGLVLESSPGFYRNVIVLDFKSLYPSIIRTFLIDPLAAAAAAGWAKGEPSVQGPAGPAFARDWAILPEIVSELSEARERAKRERDASLSQAVKIIMNSFYGVLGNATCRFYHPDLAGAITRSGQWILLETKRVLEAMGYRVIYGDTDSLFVHAGAASAPGAPPEGASPAECAAAMRRLGADLCAALNRHLQVTLRDRFGAESRLTLEFEKIFLGFFMPSLRHEERGSKKRYAGLLVKGGSRKTGEGAPGSATGVLAGASAAVTEGGAGPRGEAAVAAELHFTGMESARSDWTDLAKDFQAALVTAAFESLAAAGPAGGGRASLERLVRDWKRRLFQGEFDDRLEYRKGLSKEPEEYSASAPPHVRAARALDAGGAEGRSRIIRYVMTMDGPEPVQKRSGARPDYRHYAEKQLAPIADMVLRFHGSDFQAATGESEQLSIL
jgi:DNA polymerase-2